MNGLNLTIPGKGSKKIKLSPYVVLIGDTICPTGASVPTELYEDTDAALSEARIARWFYLLTGLVLGAVGMWVAK